MENTQHHLAASSPEVSPSKPLRLHELHTELSKPGVEPLPQGRRSEIDTNRSQNKEK
jgi:hypothetical protein